MFYAEYTSGDAMKERNTDLLSMFAGDLAESGMSERNVAWHLMNVNTIMSGSTRWGVWLPMEDIEDGADLSLDRDFEHCFRDRCQWTSPEAIRSASGSFRRFCRSMLDHGQLGQNEYDRLNSVIDGAVSA